ncbi:MAG: hypothetical protein ACI9TV_002664 [Sulfurimonas sp.]|uniref:hypothetical protein n=1 Tax=Sulfurimonas sp. TaxID=2022749 RepID=UPI0039E7025C
MDVESKKMLTWKNVESELVKDYIYLKEELIEFGYTIQSVILDTKRGLYKAFKDITMRPNLEASKGLKKIVSRLTHTTEIIQLKSLMNGSEFTRVLFA